MDHLLESKKKLKNLKKLEIQIIFTKANLIKPAYGGFKDLKRRTFADKVLKGKALNIAKTPKYDEYQKGLLLSFLIKSGELAVLIYHQSLMNN